MAKVFFSLFISISLAQANIGQGDPLQIIKNIFDKTRTEKFKNDSLAQKEVTSVFDYGIMTKDILGTELKKHSSKEIVWFKNKIRDIVSKTVYPNAYDFLLNVKLEHEILEKSKNKFSVLTVVKKRGEETEVVSRFKRVNKNWKIIDITIDDESWVENIQEQVHKTIKKKKWSGLKASLTKRLKDLNSGKKVENNLE